MGSIRVGIIFLLGVSLVGIVHGQGTCTICALTTPLKNCTTKYYPPLPINDSLCTSLAKNEHIEKTICIDFPHGYQIPCEQAVTGNEYLCKYTCPPPPVIQEKYYGGTGTALVPGRFGVLVMPGFLVIILTWIRL